LKNAINLPVN